MKVKEKYYKLLKSGLKTIELRLFDKKRQDIHLNDKIVFTNLDDETDMFMARVIKLYRADSFETLCEQIPVQKAGFNSSEELVRIMREFYPLESQKKYGVLGIEVKREEIK